MTKYGKMIADVVLTSYDHPTAEQIFFRVKEIAGNISMATVYNNLKSLTEAGVLRKISLNGSPDRFDKPTHHGHLVCEQCGKLSDTDLHDMTHRLESETGLSIISYDLRINYICSECAEKGKKDVANRFCQ